MRHRTHAVVIIGFAALCAVEASGGAIGRWLAVGRATAILNSVPGLSVGAVSARGDALAIDDLDFGAAAGARVHIGRLTLPGSAAGPARIVVSARAAPAGITATDVSITIKGTVISIPTIEAQGTYLTADRLKALFDPSTSLTLADRLGELTAASLTAPMVTITDKPSASNADGDRTTLEDVALTDVVAGRIGSAVIRSTTLYKAAAPGGTAIGTLGSVTVNGLDLPLAVRIVQTARTDPAEPARAVYGSLSIRDVAITPDDTVSFKIGAIRADGFRGRPLLRRPADIVALIDKPSDSQTPEDVQALANTAIDAAKGISLDHLEWDDVALTGQSKGPFAFKIGRMVIDDVSPSQIGTWTVADLAVTSDEASFALRQMALHTPDESQYIDILAHELATSGLAMDRTKLMSGIPQDGSLSMIGLHVDVPSPDQPGNSRDGRRNVFDVPLLSFASATDPTSKVATSTAHMQASYALPAASDNPGFSALSRSGFKGIDSRADYRLVFDPKTGGFKIDPLTIAAEKLGRLSLSADVGNVPYELLARGRPASDSQAALDRITFKDMSLDFRNDGVVEMFLPVLAAASQTSVPLLKVGAKTQSDLFIGQTLGTTPAAARLEAAIDAFIDNPRNLHLAVTAPAGLTGAEIEAASDPKALLDRLGIEAEANR